MQPIKDDNVPYPSLVSLLSERHRNLRESPETSNKADSTFKVGYLSYDERLRILGIPRLEQRRLRGDLIETYKLVTHREKVHPDIFFQRNPNTQLRGHPSKISQKQSRLIVRSNFFSQRIMKFWNNLPKHVAQTPSLHGAFKKRLYESWKNMTWDEIQANRRSKLNPINQPRKPSK